MKQYTQPNSNSIQTFSDPGFDWLTADQNETLKLTDVGCSISASGITITIPSGLPIGTERKFLMTAQGTSTIEFSGGETLSSISSFNISGIGNVIKITKQDDNSWTAEERNKTGFKNLIINGDFPVAQRGPGPTTVSNAYTIDMLFSNGLDITTERKQFTQGQTDVPGAKYYTTISVATGGANKGARLVIENPEQFTGTYTLSFYAKGTNPGGGLFDSEVFYRNSSKVFQGVLRESRFSVTSEWQRYIFTMTAPDISAFDLNGGHLSVSFDQDSADSSTDAWTLDLADVQLERGTQATEFERRPYGLELSLCQRYYQVLDFTSTNPATPILIAARSSTASGAGAAYTSITLPVSMRSEDIDFSTDGTWSGGGATTPVKRGSSSNLISVATSATSFSPGDTVFFINGRILLSAEL